MWNSKHRRAINPIQTGNYYKFFTQAIIYDYIHNLLLSLIYFKRSQVPLL